MSYSICILQAIAFLDLLAVGLIVPILPGHVRNLGGNHLHVGLLGSIYAGFQLGSGPFIGSLSDLKGRKLILVITLLVSSIAYTAFGFTSNLILILFIRAILGFFKQTQMLTKAMVADYERDEQKQGEIYGKMLAISGAGITIGPIIGGHIAEDFPYYGFTFIACIVGLCFIINAGLVTLLPKSIKSPKHRKNSKEKEPSNLLQLFTDSVTQSFIQLYKIKWSVYGDVFLLKGLIGFAMGVYYSNYALYLRTQYDLSPKYIGYVISFQGTVGAVSSYFMGFINSFYDQDKDYSQRNYHVFLLLTFALIGLILSFNVYLYSALLIPLAIGNAMGRLITLEMVLNRSKGDHVGTLIGASNSVRSMTGVVSPMVAGVIGQFVGVEYVIYASLLSTFVGLVLSYQYRQNSQKQKYE